MLLFSFAILTLIAGSLPWVALARLSSKTAWLLGLYLATCANMTVTFLVLNPLELMASLLAVLAIHFVIGLTGWLWWARMGKPSVWGPFEGWRPSLGWVRSDPLLALLAAGVAVSYLFGLVELMVIPQNNMDSLSAHLTRIVFWRQQGSLFPWSTSMPNQVWYPINAQLQTYWTLLFLGSDRLVGGVQWLAALVTALSVFGLARQLGFARRPAALAALIFLTYPLVVLQATTPQTDLVTAVYFIPAVYFLLIGLKDGRHAPLLLSAVSVGIGIGVKKSYFILLPVLAVVALIAFLQWGRRSWKPLSLWSVYTVLAIAVLGAYLYAFNWWYFGDPFGAPGYLDQMLEVPQSRIEPAKVWLSPLQQTEPPGNSRVMELIYNAPRLFYQSLDTSGLPRPLDGYAHKVKMRVFRFVFQAIGFDEIEGTAYTAPGHVFSFTDKNINEESHAWYGPLSFLLVIPALFMAARRGLRDKQYVLLIPLLGLLIFLPLEILLRPGWDPFQGRYFAPIAALCAPLIAIWFKDENSTLGEWVVAVLALVIVVTTFLYNPSKPTLGKYAEEFHIWTNTDRIFLQTIQRKNDRWVYRMVEKSVPKNATLGYHIPFFFMEYPLFGEHLQRRLVPMGNPALVTDLGWQQQHGVDYLLLPDWPDVPPPPKAYAPIDHVSGWTLYALQTTP